MRILVLSFKKFLFTFLILAFILSLVLFSKSNLDAAKNGLLIWTNSIIPSLFPFFVATELLCSTNFINIMGDYLNRFMRPLFNVPGQGSFALIMGIISGYPTGAKIVCNLRNNKLCSKIEAERLLAFTNNSGPLFIISVVGISIFSNAEIGYLLLFTHILSAITIGIIFRFWKKSIDSPTKTTLPIKSNVNQNDFASILTESIKKSISTILTIGGFVVIFSVIISILENFYFFEFFGKILSLFNISDKLSIPFLSGFIELSNGISRLRITNTPNISNIIILAAFLLGFGGISVALQVYSIISKTDISIKPYILAKLLQGIIASTYTFLILNFIPLFNLNL
ncbi:MAG: sporulation integral membrane protein YlbJ [Candidatus Scatovivens sp.]